MIDKTRFSLYHTINNDAEATDVLTNQRGGPVKAANQKHSLPRS